MWDEITYPILYNECNYLSVLELKLVLVAGVPGECNGVFLHFI